MKKFLIIGNSNAITYKSIFPHIASGEWFIRTKNGTVCFAMNFTNSNGENKIISSVWYTNLDSRHLYKTLELTKTYDPEKYPKYDNFDGIEVSKLRDMPYDYDGVMGVPISVVLFSPEQFEIMGDTNPLARGGLINGKYTYKRVPVRLRKKKDKKFLILGNGNVVTTKDIFPLIKDNKMWLGASKGMGGKPIEFIVDETIYEETKGSATRKENGICYVGVMMITWFTNMEHNKRKEPLILTKKYDPALYPKYDNYSAINVDKVKDIPYDYDGVMGVPISFLDKYCHNQFEIIKFRKGNDDKDLSVNGKCPYFRILIKRVPDKKKVEFEIIDYMASHGKEPKGIPHEAPYLNGKWLYNRLLIKKK